MRFSLIDRITELREGESVTAIKVLSMAEEYLADHFPRFPVMPGVMMLESMYQACAWLVRKSENFAHAMVVLREARNVKFSNFVEPGQVLVVQGHDREAGRRDDDAQGGSHGRRNNGGQRKTGTGAIQPGGPISHPGRVGCIRDATNARAIRVALLAVAVGECELTRSIAEHTVGSGPVYAGPWPLPHDRQAYEAFPRTALNCVRGNGWTNKSIGDDAHGTHERRSV